jgi:hypothetical protein
LSLAALILEKSPPFLERQRLGTTRRVNAYNAQPATSLHAGAPSPSSQHKSELFATSLEEGCNEFEEGW